jgi:hypothetical protein
MTDLTQPIVPEEFTSFKPGVKPIYSHIEEILIEMGGRGVAGNNFKKEMLTKAGWKYGALISYGAHPETAAAVFNKIRELLGKTREKEEFVSLL